MKIFKKSCFFLFIIGLSPFIEAQERFDILDDFKNVKFDEYIKVYNTPDSVDPNNLINNKKINWNKNKVTYGFSNDYYWLKFKIKNTSSKPRNLYFEIDNPHIRFIEFYELKNNGLHLIYKCGRYMPFSSRPIDNVKFIFPINLNLSSAGNFFVKIDKRTTSVSFPTQLWDQNEFNKINNKTNLINGVLFGAFILILLYSLLVFFYLKRILYLWYGMYILFVGLYLFTSIGYSFQYINQNSVEFNSVLRVITLVLLVIFHIKFIQELLKTKLYVKKLHTTLNAIIYVFLTIIIGKFIFPMFYDIYSSLYIKSLYVLILLSIICCLLIAILTYNKQKKIVKLYVFSSGIFVFGGLLLLAFEFGWLLYLRTAVSPLFIGSLLEIIILSIVLVSEMRLIDQEKKSLSLKIIDKQQEVVQAYVEGVEREKLRISGELHDDIGSQLANLSRVVAHEDKVAAHVHKKIVAIINDVRSISHKLSPNKGSLLSFREQLHNLLEETFANTEMICKHHFLGEYTILSDQQKLNIYRVLQEFLHNILKHANATVIELQLIKLENEITLTLEDNGIGFNLDKKNKGLGLENVQRRIDYLKGTMEISSVPNQGTFIVVSIPIAVNVKK